MRLCVAINPLIAWRYHPPSWMARPLLFSWSSVDGPSRQSPRAAVAPHRAAPVQPFCLHTNRNQGSNPHATRTADREAPRHQARQGPHLDRDTPRERHERGLTWKQITRETGGLSPVRGVGPLVGQMNLFKPLAKKAAAVFGLSE